MKYNYNKLLNKYTVSPTDEETVSMRQDIVDSLLRLDSLIPSKYCRLKIANIILPKTESYYTSLGNKYYWYCRLKMTLQKFKLGSYLSSKIAFKVVMLKKQSLDRWASKKKVEIKINEYSLDKKSSLDDKIALLGKEKINIFFASAQTYVRVVAKFMENSDYVNNIIVVPRLLENTKILQSINKSNILYFDDFITEEIQSKYVNSISEFESYYEKNIELIEKNFVFDGNNYFKLIEVGLKNIYKFLIPQAYLFVMVYERILTKIQVKNVIGIRVRKIYDRSLYETACRLKIPRYVLLHSNIGIGTKFIHSMGNFSNITGVFVWGIQQKKLISNDIFSNVDKIYVYGSPLFDDCRKYRELNHTNNTNINKKILYAAGLPDLDELTSLVKFVNNHNREHTNKIDLIIKVHPGDSSSVYKHFINNNIILLSAEKILEEYLLVVDLLVTTISESCLQAALYNVPMHLMIFSDFSKQLALDIYGLSVKENKYLTSCNQNMMWIQLESILFNPKYRDTLLETQSYFLDRRIHMPADHQSSTKLIGAVLNK